MAGDPCKQACRRRQGLRVADELYMRPLQMLQQGQVVCRHKTTGGLPQAIFRGMILEGANLLATSLMISGTSLWTGPPGLSRPRRAAGQPPFSLPRRERILLPPTTAHFYPANPADLLPFTS